jgi:hypothetical protein
MIVGSRFFFGFHVGIEPCREITKKVKKITVAYAESGISHDKLLEGNESPIMAPDTWLVFWG